MYYCCRGNFTNSIKEVVGLIILINNNMSQIRKGYIQSKIEPEQYILGASKLPQVVLRPDGNWKPYEPDDEPQLDNNFDTFNCTGFNTLGAIETLECFLTGIKQNYSDRWLGIVAGTKPPGNDPQTVCEAIRKHGLIPDSMLPFSDDIQNVDEYYSFKGANEAECRAEGQKWLNKWEFGHEWVLSNSVSGWKERMELALTYSPLAGAVYAWQQKGGGIVREADLFIRPDGGEDGHWTEIVKASPVTHWEIVDSYPPYDKQLVWDFGFTYVKRFYMKLKDPQAIKEVKISLIQRILNLMYQLLEELKKQYGRVFA